MHEAGFAWCDLSFDNILVNKTWDSLVVSDLENATTSSNAEEPLYSTPGFTLYETGVLASKRDDAALKALRLYLDNPILTINCIRTGDFSPFWKDVEHGSH
ncbi:hypothetical protein ATOP_08530 [Granulimonas faecalis]|uniref:Protein kinase domain-containing protein n=1 Tax=Granulimonas faecalis TaxID=2894155 RepID=A0AAV5B2Y6_9ACTN|nr:hypothetical protein ATOP_08530 [Granulimonas faecalis]